MVHTLKELIADDALFVFDLANNHQGSVDHGRGVIRSVAQAVSERGLRGIFKFQFRELDTFVHPAHQTGSNNKHVPRFLSTRLSWSQFGELFDEVRAQGLVPMTTPFDEASVDRAVEMGFDILKVASCSAKDWPLLEKVAMAGKPVIFSTGGCSMADIDNLVSFFEHRAVDFGIMHCISLYPTPREACALNQIDALRMRFPTRPVGWSTHEEQDEVAPLQIAYAKGARIFERHVGMPAEGISLNAYSSNPEQVGRWLDAYVHARALCGPVQRPASAEAEQRALIELRRGVFAKRALQTSDVVQRDDVYFAMPCETGQLHSGQVRPGMTLLHAVAANGPLMENAVQFQPDPGYLVLKTAVHEIKAMLNEAKITLNSDFSVEYSHHLGLSEFPKVGCVLIDCVNREYCKKLLVQLPGQAHPLHYHRRKEETFQVLAGVLHLEIDGRERVLYPGDTTLVLPGVWHRFWSDTGAIVEEVSTTHYTNDSFYKDARIQETPLDVRKTRVTHWGRFEITDKFASESS